MTFREYYELSWLLIGFVCGCQLGIVFGVWYGRFWKETRDKILNRLFHHQLFKGESVEIVLWGSDGKIERREIEEPVRDLSFTHPTKGMPPFVRRNFRFWYKEQDGTLVYQELDIQF